MPIPPLNKDKKYTYADYLTWPEEERWEIFDGVPYGQAAPTWQHQAISSALLAQFTHYLQNKPCLVFAAPFDVRIPENDEEDEDTTFVCQPDLVVVCDKAKLKRTGFCGVPTLIIEISSPFTANIDKVFKFNKFEKAGVIEYWIIEPEGKFVSVFTLQDTRRYGRPDVYSDEDKIQVKAFPGLVVELQEVFANI